MNRSKLCDAGYISSGFLGILEGDEILSVNNIDIEKAEDDIVDLLNALAGTRQNDIRFVGT